MCNIIVKNLETVILENTYNCLFILEICTIQESLRNVIDEESSLQKKNNMRITVEDLRSQAIHTYGATVDLTQKS